MAWGEYRALRDEGGVVVRRASPGWARVRCPVWTLRRLDRKKPVYFRVHFSEQCGDDLGVDAEPSWGLASTELTGPSSWVLWLNSHSLP